MHMSLTNRWIIWVIGFFVLFCFGFCWFSSSFSASACCKSSKLRTRNIPLPWFLPVGLHIHISFSAKPTSAVLPITINNNMSDSQRHRRCLVTGTRGLTVNNTKLNSAHFLTVLGNKMRTLLQYFAMCQLKNSLFKRIKILSLNSGAEFEQGTNIWLAPTSVGTCPLSSPVSTPLHPVCETTQT